MRGFFRYLFRYFCARCTYDVVRTVLRRKPRKPRVPPCNHISGVLLSILLMLTVLPLLALGLLGAIITGGK